MVYIYLWLCICLLTTVHAVCPQSFEGLTGTVINSTNPFFSVDILDANQGFSPIPCVVVFCSSEQDVVNAVRFAASNKIIPSVRSGRHSYMAYSVINDSILIDVSELNEITDLGQDVIKFGAGVRLIEAYDFASSNNLVFPGGTCPSVGVSGFVLGGGYGYWARKYGLAIDSVVSLDIVLATGVLITANETHHPDLFWACRGGGNGNFGVVTSLTLSLPRIPASQPITKYVIDWNGDQSMDVIDGWQNWLTIIPDELTANLVIYHTSISSYGVFIGTSSDLKAILLPLLKLGTVVRSNITTMSFRDAILSITGCSNFTQCLQEGRQEPAPNGHGFRGKSSYVSSTLSVAGMQTLIAYEQGPLYHTNCAGCGFTAVMIDSYGGSINTHPQNWTAFPHRNMSYHMQTLTYWQNTTSTMQEANDWIRSFYDDMLPHVSPFAYVNYIDQDITNWEYAYYSENYPQLHLIKGQYDPSNMFRNPQSIS